MTQLKDLKSPASLAPLKPSPHLTKADSQSGGMDTAMMDSANQILKKNSLMTFRLPDSEPVSSLLSIDTSSGKGKDDGGGISSAV